MKHIRKCLAGVAVAMLLSGCVIHKQGPKFDARDRRDTTTLTNLASVSSTNRIQPEWLTAPTNFYRLGPGDRLEVEILGDPSTRTMTTVAPDGRLYYYLLPGLDVWGLTLEETRLLLQDELKQYLTNPQVGVQLRGVDSSRVWVLGRVQEAGVYPMSAPMTLIEALTLAGGPMTSAGAETTEELADLSHSFIIRNGERLPVDFEALLNEGDMSQNIYLQPDDFIYLPSSLSRDIYVLGAVRQPQAVARRHGTLSAAVAQAGGTIKDAYVREVAIVRGSMSDPKIALVNYDEIIKGKAPDVVLDPQDIVYVPFSPYRFLNKYLDLALTTFAQTVGLNEGTRSVSGNAPPVGVSIPIGSVVTPAPVIIR